VRRLVALVLALVLTADLAPCAAQSPRAAVDTPDWRGTGIVLKLLPPPSDLHATRPVIVIQHDPIAGLMAESMAMPFLAASTALFGGLRVGDRIAFGLKETADALLVISIERLPPGR
jgi:Cu/Ag efflux protein CusF